MPKNDEQDLHIIQSFIFLTLLLLITEWKNYKL